MSKKRLFIDLDVGQAVHVGEAHIRLTDKTGRKARMQITANENVRVVRDDKKDKSGVDGP